MITIDVQEHRPFCTPEYYVWILEDVEHRYLSEGGLRGLAMKKREDGLATSSTLIMTLPQK